MNDDKLSSDMPLADATQDALGVDPLAKNLASSLISMSPSDGMVMAIYGDWGTGKSTLMNFIRSYLEQHKPENEQPYIIPFHPWQFSGHQDLVRSYFTELALSLTARAGIHDKAESLTGSARELADLAGKLAEFGETVGDLPAWMHTLTGGLTQGVGVISAALKKREKPLEALRGEIEDLLARQDRKLVVFIDDIDRLTPGEIRDVFRMVKAVANFPNVIYLLAFDKGVVSQALDAPPNLSGADYIEKIVQFDIALPKPDTHGVFILFTQRLDQIIAQNHLDATRLDRDRWTLLYHKFLKKLMITPRQAVRLSNTLAVTLPGLGNEVNLVDYVAIEALRLFFPEIYDEVRANPESFAGLPATSQDHHDRSFYRQRYNELCAREEEAESEALRDVMKLLFPKVESGLGNVVFDPSRANEWAKDARVCSAKHFHIYFRYVVPEDHLTQVDMEIARKIAHNQEEFEALLRSFSQPTRSDGTSKLSDFLDRFLHLVKIDDALKPALPSVIRAFLTVGDEIDRPEDEPRGFMDFNDTPRQTSWIVLEAIEKSPKEERYPLLIEALQKSPALYTIVETVISLGVDHGRWSSKSEDELLPEEERNISFEQFEECERVVIERIRAASEDGTLQQTWRLAPILAFWSSEVKDNAEIKKEIQDWVRKATVDDTGLLEFLLRLSTKGKRTNVHDGIVREKVRIVPSFVGRFLDIDRTYERVCRILEGGAAEGAEKDVAETFKVAVERVWEGVHEDRL